MGNICVGLFYFFGNIMFWNKCFHFQLSFFEVGFVYLLDNNILLDMSPYMECKCDNITYVFCILNDTLLASWQRSMIKLSIVCPYALKSMKQKIRPNGS